MDLFLSVLSTTMTVPVLGALLFGTVLGLIFGAIPGLTYSMALALVLPMTFGMDAVPAIAIMLSTYIGGACGGTISAILIGVPGTPSAAATVMDGHALAKSGKASLTLGVAVVVSTIGGIFSLAIMLISVSMLAKVALAFGPAEITALVIFGLSTICGLASGSLLRGLVGGVLGLMVMTIGQDPIDGQERFTFGTVTLLQGVDLLVAMIGLFAIPQVIETLALWRSGSQVKNNSADVKVEMPGLRLLASQGWNIARSGLIGTLVGAIPGTGGPIAAFLAYDQAKRFSRHPERFGKGEMAGVVAPETANNAVTGGAMIPLLGLGIPGDPATAIILGGLMIHGLQPGPLLFSQKPDVVMGIYILFAASYLLVLFIQLFGIRLFVMTLRIPAHLLAIGILVMCVVGSFAIRNTLFDVLAMLTVGFIGYLLGLARVPVAPVLLGLVLGPTLEREVRTALVMSEGSYSIFFDSAPALVFLGLAVLVIGSQALGSFRTRKAQQQEA